MNRIILNEYKNEAEINIFGRIGSSMFEKGYTKEDAEQDILGNRDKDLIVNIFSGGGSLMDGLFIYDLLNMHPKKVTVNILTLAGSAATLIALGADVVRISSNAQFMIHEPVVGANLKPSNADEYKEYINKAYDIIINIYQKKTGLNESELRLMMDKKDNFLSAEEALKLGFVDEIFETSSTKTELKKIAISGAEVYNHFKIKEEEMDLEKYNELENQFNELTNNFNDLNEQVETLTNENVTLLADKEEISNKFNELNEKLVSEVETKEALEASKLELENTITEMNTEIVNTFIENAIKDNKILVTQKEQYLKLAHNDFETVKSIVDNVPARTKIDEIINQSNVDGLEVLLEGKEKWDIIDFEKKDKTTLNILKEKYTEKYNELHKKTYGE